MDFDLQHYIATFAGYALPLAALFFVSRKWPTTWHGDEADPSFARPRVELALAFLAVVAIIGLNIVYNSGGLLPEGSLGGATFVVNLLLIWSPIVILLAWRKHGPDTSLLVPRALPQKLAWGIGASVLGMATFLLINGNAADLGLSVTLLGGADPIRAFQSLVQFAGVGFLFYRIVAAAGKTAAIVTCSLLYGLVKYPYYMGHYGMGFPEATSVIAFSIGVAFFVMSVIYDRRDILVVAILHIFMDMVQNV